MRRILEKVARVSREGAAGAVASVMSASGSLPMSRRSKMLVLPGGEREGTVGGGCLEAEVLSMAGRVIRSRVPRLARFALTEKEAGVEGLNCGGTVRILVEPIGTSRREGRDVYQQALEYLERGEPSVFVTMVEGAQESNRPGAADVRIAGRALVASSGLVAGAGSFDDQDGPLVSPAADAARALLGRDRAEMVRIQDRDGDPVTLFVESLQPEPLLYLFGGGHVSLAVARVASMAGFRVVVIDDRPEFCNPGRFPEAERTLVRPMEGALDDLPIGAEDSIVIVTRGHQHDEPIVEQAIRTRAAYIGMIGSKRKIGIMWKRLESRGADSRTLARVRAPIGLDIGADTPGEIAVSIVAEMIRNRRRGHTRIDEPNDAIRGPV